MTQQQREDAIKQVEGQLKCGYVDFSGSLDSDELEIIKEAISLLKAVDKFNSIGCTSFWFTPGQEKPIKVAFEGTEATSEEDKFNMNMELLYRIGEHNFAALDCSDMSDEEIERILKGDDLND